MSFRWLEPRCGSLTMMASPPRMRSGPYSRIELGAITLIGTKWAGWAKDWATQRKSLSKKAQEKSARVLMLVEKAARRMVTAISSVMLMRALRMTSKVTGSIAGRSTTAASSTNVLAGFLAVTEAPARAAA